MVFSFTGISCILLSAGTGAYFVKKSCYSYKKHTMNIYTYLMHILMASCIIGKSLCFYNKISSLIHSEGFIFLDNDRCGPRIAIAETSLFDMDVAAFLLVDGCVRADSEMGLRPKPNKYRLRQPGRLTTAAPTLQWLHQINSQLHCAALFVLYVLVVFKFWEQWTRVLVLVYGYFEFYYCCGHALCLHVRCR